MVLHQILVFDSFYTKICSEVSSSSGMETFAAKSLILNLAWEHGLEIYSLTTDRAKDMKTLMRYGDKI